MRNRLNVIWKYSKHGACIGAFYGYAINYHIFGINPQFHPDDQVISETCTFALDINEQLKSLTNSEYGHLMVNSIPFTLALIGGISGLMIGSYIPIVDDSDFPASDADIEIEENNTVPAAPIPINPLQKALDDAGYNGPIPECFLDTSNQIMEEPHLILTENSGIDPVNGQTFTAQTFNRSSVRSFDAATIPQLHSTCPYTRQTFTQHIPNLELKAAAHAWANKIINKTKRIGEARQIPEYFLDPQTKKIMNNPCIILTDDPSQQKSYDITTIESWTDRSIKIHKYIPNRELKEAINLWMNKKKEKYGVESINERYGLFTRKDHSGDSEKKERKKTSKIVNY